MKISKTDKMILGKDAVVRCYGTHMCGALNDCGKGNDTATINSENYEAVKAAYTPSPSQAS